MNDEQLQRYSRQILLPQIGLEGQRKLLNSSVLIVGLGGLGSPLAMYLAAAGVGHLLIADGDRVDLSNLQRQIIHRNADIGRSKVESARDALHAINPEVKITPLDARLAEQELADAVSRVDVVADASDNFATRFALNAACVHAHKPLVSGAAIRMEGQVAVYDPRRHDSPCYRCLYRDDPGEEEGCAQLGVLAPVPGVIGAVQAVEVIKLLAGSAETLTGWLLVFDALVMEWRKLKLAKDPDCPVCGAKPR
ncbi:MAG TPA: molybdopterin-synthase adenylyltransferase MoeB [Gammaproteobacteria bacterium]|nr:molybdopterin-synthase adenylyltransferase MoeB [Gammaproteobacteria bacterium]